MAQPQPPHPPPPPMSQIDIVSGRIMAVVQGESPGVALCALELARSRCLDQSIQQAVKKYIDKQNFVRMPDKL